jgi:hypothetical protein
MFTLKPLMGSFPLEHLGQDPTPPLQHLFRGRATIARFALDLLDDTTPSTRASRTRQPSHTSPRTCSKTPRPAP